MISIVIPVYNGEKYLDECITSCINQTYSDYEIIIVDDGSTDSTAKIIMKYYHQYPNLIVPLFKQNGGTASALNMGIDNMRGEWFKWLSADDTLFDDSLKELMNYADNVATLYYTDYEIIDENSKHVSYFADKQYDNQPAELYHNFFGNGSTSLINKHAFRVVGKFKEDMPYNDDYEFWMRWVLKHGLSMKHIPSITCKYRIHNDSLTSTKDIEANRILVEALRKQYYQYLRPEDLEYLKTLRKPLKKRLVGKIPSPILKQLMRLKN